VLLRTSVNSSGIESDSRTFVFGNYIDEVLMMRQPTGTEYLYGHDHLYSPAVLFDAAGTVVRRYEYDVYGRMRPYSATWGSVPWPAWQILGNYYAFTGRELDRVGTSQTGILEIMYYRARYYDPDTGRFLQPDPLGLDPAGGGVNPFAPTSQYTDGMNVYLYARCNSCRWGDPWGLKSDNPKDWDWPWGDKFDHETCVLYCNARFFIDKFNPIPGWEDVVEEILESFWKKLFKTICNVRKLKDFHLCLNNCNIHETQRMKNNGEGGIDLPPEDPWPSK